MDSKKLGLDHYKVYNVPNREAGYKVILKGEFDEEPVTGELPYLDLFANPVIKDREPGFDTKAHFTMYNLFCPEEPMRLVWFENQFGKARWYLGNPFYLMVPAHKGDTGPFYQGESLFPEKMNHYKVYRVRDYGSGYEERRVMLEDQWGRAWHTMSTPVAYGVPVAKEHDGQRFPIVKEQPHLTFYALRRKLRPKSFWAFDQFGRRKLGPVVWRVWLAVPALCEGWERTADPSE